MSKYEVDVSKCSLRCANRDCGLFYVLPLNTDNPDFKYSHICSDNPECYYKQLQSTQIQYNKIVEQNRSLQKELRQKNQEIEAFKLSEGEAVEIIADLEEKLDTCKLNYHNDTDMNRAEIKTLQRTTTQYNKLAEQNESLQTEIISLQEKIECLKYAAEISNNGLKAVTDKAIKLAEVNNVLRKTLKEIEEIAEDRSLYCENCDNDTITCEDCGYIKILSKIKEAKK